MLLSPTLGAVVVLGLGCAARAQVLAEMDLRPGLSPRYYLEASPLARRQSVCTSGSHPCDDIGESSCCADDTYCMVNASWQAVCCQIGSTCNSVCSEDHYLCNITTTITTVNPASVATNSACCPRRCTSTSMFGCPTSLGGGCCSYGQICASSSQCLATSTASSTGSAIVSEIPSGCTTSQIGCSGGGCCNVGYTCTQISNTGYCALDTVQPTASGVSSTSQGLSDGAKAGIGAGIAVGACVVIGIATWFCIRHRRHEQSRRQSASGERQSVPSGRSPGASGVPAMSEDTSDVASRRGPVRGLTQDYFGPDAIAGPYTDTGNDTSARTSPGRDRGVPAEPHGPHDIAAPVEIDSRIKDDTTDASSTARSWVRFPVPQVQEVPNTIHGRFELYGSDMHSHQSPFTPSSDEVAPSPDEQSRQEDTG